MKTYKYKYTELQNAQIVGGGSGGGTCDHCGTHLKHFVDVIIAGEKASIGCACASQILSNGEKPASYYMGVVRNVNARKAREERKAKAEAERVEYKRFMGLLFEHHSCTKDEWYQYDGLSVAEFAPYEFEYVGEVEETYYGKTLHKVVWNGEVVHMIPPARILPKLLKGAVIVCHASFKEKEVYYNGTKIFNSLTKVKFLS